MGRAETGRRGPRLFAWLALALLIGLGGCSGRTAPPASVPPPLAEPAPEFDRLFQRSGDGWTGGDGTLSVALPDGRTAWLFGDTLLGTVAADQTRAADTPFIHNSLVVQSGPSLETRHGHRAGAPAAFFDLSEKNEWYWPGDGTVESGNLYVFLHRFRLEQPKLWAWRWTGTAIATLSLPDLRWTGTGPAPSENGVLYGVCLLETDTFTYIYGTRDESQPKQAHVARAPAGNLLGTWHHFDGRRWSDQSTDTTSILAGVSTQYTVIQACQGYYLFSMDGRVPFSNVIVAYRSRAPTGPWQGPQTVYQAPEANTRIAVYNPFAHTQFSDRGRVLLSYNVNHVSDPDALLRDARIYRPRFIRVDLGQLERRFHDQEK